MAIAFYPTVDGAVSTDVTDGWTQEARTKQNQSQAFVDFTKSRTQENQREKKYYLKNLFSTNNKRFFLFPKISFMTVEKMRGSGGRTRLCKINAPWTKFRVFLSHLE